MGHLRTLHQDEHTAGITGITYDKKDDRKAGRYEVTASVSFFRSYLDYPENFRPRAGGHTPDYRVAPRGDQPTEALRKGLGVLLRDWPDGWYPSVGYPSLVSTFGVTKDGGRGEYTHEAVTVALKFKAPKPSLLPSEDEVRALPWDAVVSLYDTARLDYCNGLHTATENMQVTFALRHLAATCAERALTQAKRSTRYAQRLAALEAELVAEIAAESIPETLGWLVNEVGGGEDSIPDETRQAVKLMGAHGKEIVTKAVESRRQPWPFQSTDDPNGISEVQVALWRGLDGVKTED